MKKRLGLYATYNKEGVLDEYVLFCLKEYRKLVDELIVVSNQTFEYETKKKLDFVDWIFERSDKGYDVGAFADVLTNLYGWERIQEFEQIIFMNDSIFGPFYPLEPIMQEMEARGDIDFWGLTKRGQSDFDGGEEIYPAHIQLYYYVVNSRMLHSKVFVEYWENIMQYVTDFRSAIVNYEFGFTAYFEEKGFKWDVAITLPGYDAKQPQMNLSPYHYNSYDLIKSGKYPFIKRKLFTGEFVYSKYTDKSDLRRSFDYICTHTEYDQNLIWDYILRNYELGRIMDSLCLYEVMPTENTKSVSTKNRDNYVFLIIEEENERDTQALFDAKHRMIVENMMRDEAYMENIIGLFEENCRLGVVIPPMNTYGRIIAPIEKRWCDSEKAENIYRKLKLSIPFFKEKAPVHEIHAVWCRKEIIDFIESVDKIEKVDATFLQMVTLVAQNLGYYTEVVENIDYLKYYLTGTQTIMRKLLKFLQFDKDLNMTLEECETEMMKRKVEEVARQGKDIYIYGAGEKAFRLISVAETIADIKGIIVSEVEGNPSNILGYEVKSISDMEQWSKNIVVIVTVGEKNRIAVATRLQELGLKKYIFV